LIRARKDRDFVAGMLGFGALRLARKLRAAIARPSRSICPNDLTAALSSPAARAVFSGSFRNAASSASSV